VVVIGPSGAGKSTFAQLVPRFYDARDGEVRIDDTRTSHARRVAEPREPKRSGIRHALGLLFG
jgi:ABC-type transport system involved in cytochrome bd biosynthesis fused ATPase/permease subunit